MMSSDQREPIRNHWRTKNMKTYQIPKIVPADGPAHLTAVASAGIVMTRGPFY